MFAHGCFNRSNCDVIPDGSVTSVDKRKGLKCQHDDNTQGCKGIESEPCLPEVWNADYGRRKLMARLILCFVYYCCIAACLVCAGFMGGI